MQACKDLFSYVSPKMPEYYMEFREISHEEQLALEDAKVEGVYKEMNDNFDATVKVIKEITVELPKTEETDAIQE